jgi:hypothetical protein
MQTGGTTIEHQGTKAMHHEDVSCQHTSLMYKEQVLWLCAGAFKATTTVCQISSTCFVPWGCPAAPGTSPPTADPCFRQGFPFGGETFGSVVTIA